METIKHGGQGVLYLRDDPLWMLDWCKIISSSKQDLPGYVTGYDFLQLNGGIRVLHIKS